MNVEIFIKVYFKSICKDTSDGGFGDKGCRVSGNSLSCLAFRTNVGQMTCRNYQSCALHQCLINEILPRTCLETHCRSQLQNFENGCIATPTNLCSEAISTFSCNNVDSKDYHNCYNLLRCGGKHCHLPDYNCISHKCPSVFRTYYSLCQNPQECPYSYLDSSSLTCSKLNDPYRQKLCETSEQCTNECPYTSHGPRIQNMEASWSSFFIGLV